MYRSSTQAGGQGAKGGPREWEWDWPGCRDMNFLFPNVSLLSAQGLHKVGTRSDWPNWPLEGQGAVQGRCSKTQLMAKVGLHRQALYSTFRSFGESRRALCRQLSEDFSDHSPLIENINK